MAMSSLVMPVIDPKRNCCSDPEYPGAREMMRMPSAKAPAKRMPMTEFFEAPILRNDRHEDRGGQPGDGPAQQQRPLHEEGHRQPGKHRVGDGVTDECHPAQDDVRTNDPGNY